MKQFVYELLTGNTELKAKVKDITYSYPKTFENLPVVCYQLSSIKQYKTFGNKISHSEYIFIIDIFAETSLETDDIFDLVLESVMSVSTELEINDIAEETLYHKQLKITIIQ